MALTQKERSLKLYRSRKENGLCPRCGKTLDREGHYCSECLEKTRIYQKETRDFFRENHICTECRKEKVFGSEKICPECRAKKNNYRKPLDDKQKIRMNEYSRGTYKSRIEANMCTKCGKRHPVKGKKKCAICLNYDAEIHRKRRYGKKNIREYRKENHLCYYCGKEIDRKTGQLCKSCWEKCVENGMKSSGKNLYWKNDNKLTFNFKQEKE